MAFRMLICRLYYVCTCVSRLIIKLKWNVIQWNTRSRYSSVVHLDTGGEKPGLRNLEIHYFLHIMIGFMTSYKCLIFSDCDM